MKVVVICFIVIALSIWVFWSPNKVAVVNNTSITHNEEQAQQVSTAVAKPAITSQTQPHAQTPNQTAQDDEKSHLDHLSPEMKQAVKDKLFHHGPKTITKDEQGRIRMNHAGRYVNMPVAVRKADGSIEIKEYSVIPETTADATQ